MPVIWEHLEIFGIILARVGSFIMMLPVLGNRSVPAVAKIGLSALIALFLFPLATAVPLTPPSALVPFIFMVAREVVIGLVMGFVTVFIFAGIRMAGELVGRQMGFLMAKVFDPGFQSQTSIISEFYLIVMFLIYLSIGGHHFLLRGLVESYRAIPITASLSGKGIETSVVAMAGVMFLSAIKIAAPVLVSLLLTNIALGIVARTVPQMNIFMVGLPLRVIIGFLGMAVSLQLFVHIFNGEWSRFQESFAAVIKLF